MSLDKAGLNRFIQRKALKFVGAAMEAAKDELSDRHDLDVRIGSIKSSANIVSSDLTLKSDNILSEELGSETQSPKHTVGRLVKDPAIRSRIVRKAASRLK